MTAETEHSMAGRATASPQRFDPAKIAAIVAVVAILVAAFAMLGRRAFEQAALTELRQSSSFAIAGNAAALQTKLQKFRLAPLALSTDPSLLEALKAPGEEGRASLNARFEEIAAASGAAAIYLVDRYGVAFAASNFRSAQSFVGQDYSFREYFRNALENRDAEEFAIGTVSGEPGLYLSRSIVDVDGAAQGVIVVKLGFDDIESLWRQQKGLILATDGVGRIVVTGEDDLRFEVIERIDEGVVDTPPSVIAAHIGEGPVLATARLLSNGAWTVVSYEALSESLAAPRALGALTGASITALILGALGFMLHRFASNARKTQEIAAYHAQLEAAVEDRTRELKSSYAQLTDETARRERAQKALRVMQDEIAQLNRLAILGQLSAKFAHEINQPLTAMGNYVDNSLKLLEAGDMATVAQNLEIMSGLVVRAGRITSELRAFSRKRAINPKNIEIGQAIDGALLIATPALMGASIGFQRDAKGDGALVRVDRIRIEQVILNILQNSIDALKGRSDPLIRIASAFDDANVTIRFADNGPGVPSPETLFTLFHSSKETGLGLGLSISREILAEFGGDILYRRGDNGGAVFLVRLPRSAT